ncbi:MAG: hypothetical protein IKX61_01355 [Prevotella sp.]|nr:hypothetical protein [Prevotella sp.]
MTRNERNQVLESRAKIFNPKAYIKKADPRCGVRYAVCTKTTGGWDKEWTPYLPLKELENVLEALLNYDSFIKIKEV